MSRSEMVGVQSKLKASSLASGAALPSSLNHHLPIYDRLSYLISRPLYAHQLLSVMVRLSFRYRLLSLSYEYGVHMTYSLRTAVAASSVTSNGSRPTPRAESRAALVQTTLCFGMQSSLDLVSRNGRVRYLHLMWRVTLTYLLLSPSRALALLILSGHSI